MKKIISSLFLIMVAVLSVGCSLFNKDKKVSYQNTIYSKTEAIAEIKELLKINDVYYFDCDFSNMQDIEIKDISYNLSVSGTLKYDKEQDNYYLDTSIYADVKMVSNYSIQTQSGCFGFSIISSVIRPTTKVYVNGEYESTKPCIIYDQTTYKNIRQLKNNGTTTYQGNSCTMEVSVDKNFYPYKLSDSCSVESSYLKIVNEIRVDDTPVTLLIHFESASAKNTTEGKALLTKLIDYFTNNATYAKR